MITSKLLSYLTLSLILSFYYLNLSAQDKKSDIVAALNQVITPIQFIQPDSSFSDMRFLASTLKDRDIIALGEATHGTHEFFLYKDRLIRFLVSNLDFKAIAFESDFLAVEQIDDYINHKTDSLLFLGGFPLIKETKAMINWVRAYNLNKSSGDKIHFYGLEARGFRNITSRILEVMPNLKDTEKETLKYFINTRHGSIRRRDVSKAKEIIPTLYAEAKKHHQTSDLYQHYVRLLEQEISIFLKLNSFRERDQSMALNAVWIKERTANQKMIIWAHNGHVTKSQVFKDKNMGHHLREQFGVKYFSLGTDFNHGDVSVFVKNNGKHVMKSVYYPKVTSEKAFEYYFQQCKFDNFFLDINKAQENPLLKSFLDNKYEMRMIGGTATPANTKLSILKNFDLIVYVNQTKPVN